MIAECQEGILLLARGDGSRPDGPFFLHRMTGKHELPQAGSPYPGGSFSALADRGTRTALACSPLTGGSFSAPESRGARTALACSTLTGGEFFAEPQRGDSPSADGGNGAAPRGWGKKEGTPAVSLPLWTPTFPLSVSLAQIADM